MAPPLPERRLRNRSVCCLYTTPPPYPGHYRQPLTTAGINSISTNLDIASSVFNNNNDPPKGDLSTVISPYIESNIPRKPLANTAYRNLFTHGRHRSAPRFANSSNKDDDEDEPRSRIGVHQARARREFFDHTNQQQNDMMDFYGQTVKTHSITSTTTNPTDLQKQTSEGMYDAKPPKDRRRKNVSKASSGYNSLSSGESDAAEELRASNVTGEYSPQSSVLSPETPQSQTTGTSSSSLSSYLSMSKSPLSPSRSDYLNNLRSTFTDEILRVLEQDGLIQQAPKTEGNESPSPNFMAERRSSSDYNVIELSKKYRKREISQKKAMEKVQTISDLGQLQKMFDASNDEDQRLAIKNRMSDLKAKQTDRQATPAVAGERQRSTSQLATSADVHQQKEKTPEEGVKEKKDSPVRESSPSVGGIASLTRANGNGSSAAMNNTQEAKPATTKIVARSASEIKSALLRWCQSKTKGYPHVNITNYSKSWCDGMAFCALIHHFYPDSFDYSKLDPKNRRENFELAFRVAEQVGDIPALLEVDDILSMGDNPDYKCIFTYVQQFYRRFHNVP